MVHTWKPSPQEAEAAGWYSKVSLGYLATLGYLARPCPKRSYKPVVQLSGQWLSGGREKEEKEQAEEGQEEMEEEGRVEEREKGRKGRDIVLIKRTQSR